MLRYMLDTNICIYVIKNRPPQVRELFNQNGDALCISSVTLAELYYGAEKSAKPVDNRNVVEEFAGRLSVLTLDDKAAAHYGEIRATLEKEGRIIGPYDLMIAAHARSEGLTLVTNNMKEFERVDGLRIDNWIQ